MCVSGVFILGKSVCLVWLACDCADADRLIVVFVCAGTKVLQAAQLYVLLLWTRSKRRLMDVTGKLIARRSSGTLTTTQYQNPGLER